MFASLGYPDGGRFASNARIADINVEIACGKLTASTKTHGDVAAPGVTAQSSEATGCVTVAADVGKKRIEAYCNVIFAGVIVKKRLGTDCNICYRRSCYWQAHQNRWLY